MSGQRSGKALGHGLQLFIMLKLGLFSFISVFLYCTVFTLENLILSKVNYSTSLPQTQLFGLVCFYRPSVFQHVVESTASSETVPDIPPADSIRG